MSRFICVLLVFCSIVSAAIIETKKYELPIGVIEISRDTINKKTEYLKESFWLKTKSSGEIKTKTIEREAEKITITEEKTSYLKKEGIKYEAWAILITIIIIFITFFIIIIMDKKKRANISCFTSAGATWAGLFIFFNLVLFIFNGRPELAFLSFILLVALLAFESICKSLLSTKIIIINTIMFIIIIAVSIGFAVYSVSAVFFIFLLAALTFGATYGIAKVIKKIQKRKDNI